MEPSRLPVTETGVSFLKWPVFVACIAILSLAGVSSPAGSVDSQGSAASNELRLYRSLQRVETSTRLWAGESYGDIYNDFSIELTGAGKFYRKVIESGPTRGGQLLITIYGDYRTVHEFMIAYLNDQALLMRVNIFFEPTYIVGRDRWPVILDRKFPGLINTIEEKGENGEYISGKKAIEYMLRKIRRKLKNYADKFLTGTP